MSANRLYHTWFERIRQLLPGERITRLRNFAWLMVGIYQSKSIHLSDIASKIPGRAKELSIVRRLSRFLSNPAVRVREWYATIAKNLLQSMAQTVGEIRLIADGTKVGFHHQLLIIALAYRRRALPIAWTWVRCAKGHSSARKQLALLAYVRGLIPAGACFAGWRQRIWRGARHPSAGEVALELCTAAKGQSSGQTRRQSPLAALGGFDPPPRAEHLAGPSSLDRQVCSPGQSAAPLESG